MIQADSTFQGDLIDPATGARLVIRIPAWFRAADRASFAAAPLDVTTPLDSTPMSTRGIWTADAGYLPPGSF